MAVALAIVGIQVFHAQNSRPLDIHNLFTLIDTHNSSVRVSKTSIEAARHDVDVAKSQRLPDINAQLSASFIGNALLTDRNFSEVHGLHSPHFGNQFIIDASQTIYSGGALTAGIRMSELGLEKAGIASELTIQQQRFLVLSQYLDLEKIANREQVVKSNIELTKRIISDRGASSPRSRPEKRHHALRVADADLTARVDQAPQPALYRQPSALRFFGHRHLRLYRPHRTRGRQDIYP